SSSSVGAWGAVIPLPRRPPKARLSAGIRPRGPGSSRTWAPAAGPRSPARGLVVLQELAEDVDAREEAREERVADPRRAVHDVEGRLEAQLLPLALGVDLGVLVGDPAGVH